MNSCATGFVLLSMFLSGCGGESAGGSKQVPPTDVTPPPTEGEEDDRLRPTHWLSDVSNERVPACADNEAMAFGNCVGEVTFGDDLSLSISGANGTRALALPGAVMTEVWKPHYAFKESSGEAEKLLHERRVSRDWSGDQFASYLPPTIIEIWKPESESKPARFRNLEVRVSRIDFTYEGLKISYLGGVANLCGQTFKLPVLQGQIEAACLVQIGDKRSFELDLEYGWLTLEFTDLSDNYLNTPKRLSERPVEKIYLGHRPERYRTRITPRSTAITELPASENE